MEAQNFSLYLEKKKYFKSEYILASAKIVEEKKVRLSHKSRFSGFCLTKLAKKK
jgi:hypothetical protein